MDDLHPQLAALRRELEDASARARRLADRLDSEGFARRPGEGGWSPAECIEHLNLTTKAFLPRIDGALAGATRVRPQPDRNYRKDFFGRLLTWVMEPPSRVKAKATPAFMPASKTREEVMRDFEGFQAELARRIDTANEYDVGRVKLESPFSSRIRYNLLGAFSIILAHERRHLWQAEQAAGAPGER